MLIHNHPGNLYEDVSEIWKWGRGWAGQWVHDKKVMSHAAFCSVLRSQKSGKRPLSFAQRRAMMALEP